MRIDEATMPTRDLRQTARFYAHTLGLPVRLDGHRAHVTVGATRLVFVESPDALGDQHLAFTIPRGSFAAAKDWLAGRATLLRGRDGEDEFEASPTWDARSVYFDGPDRQVLELIERRALDTGYDGRFASGTIVSVSEVGVVVPDVLDAVARLGAVGVLPYGNPPSPGFAAVGDVHGLVILVPEGRPWAPTDDRIAAAGTVTVCGPGLPRQEIVPGLALRPSG